MRKEEQQLRHLATQSSSNKQKLISGASQVPKATKIRLDSKKVTVTFAATSTLRAIAQLMVPNVITVEEKVISKDAVDKEKFS